MASRLAQSSGVKVGPAEHAPPAGVKHVQKTIIVYPIKSIYILDINGVIGYIRIVPSRPVAAIAWRPGHFYFSASVPGSRSKAFCM